MTTLHFYTQEGHRKIYKYFINCFSQEEIDYYIELFREYRYNMETVELN